MITNQHIDEMEERLSRMFPSIDVTTVNMIRAEISNLRRLVDIPVAPVIPEAHHVEDAVVIETKPKKKAEKQQVKTEENAD